MLVGRVRELERIGRALESCVAGHGGMIALCGEAGIGKTRIASEISERAERQRGFSVAWGRAWETRGAPPYWPWRECLSRVAELGGDDVAVPPAVRGLIESDARSRASGAPLSGREGARADPERDRFELFEGVASFLRAVAKKKPLLVVLDDLHASDVPSLELLAFVARGLRTARVLVIGTYRDVEARRAPVADALGRISREAEILPLGPLPREDVAEIVRHEHGSFDATLAGKVFDVAEGNPLFVRETLHALALADAAVASDPIEALKSKGAGGGIASLVGHRLSGAAPDVVKVLETGAALGRQIDPGLTAAATGMPLEDVLRALREGVERGLLTTRGLTPERWVFAHVLVREAIYRELDEEKRRSLHGGIARALAERIEGGREAHLATLAHHAIEALPTGDPRDLDLALDAARRAAERARAQLAHEEAITLLEQALATWETHRPRGDDTSADTHRAELLIALGWATTEAGQLERGRELFREVATLARRSGDGRLLARAALGQGGAYVFAEIRTELVDLLREALVALGEHEDQPLVERRLVARLLARIAGALTPSPRPEEPLGLARRAIAMTENETDPRTRIDVDVGAGSAFTDFAPPAERIAVDERLLRDARQTGDRVLELRALTRLACHYIEKGDLARAAATIDARAALADALASARHRWATPLLRSMHAMHAGRFDACDAFADEAHDIATEALGEDPNAARCIALHRFTLAIFAGRTSDLPERMAEALRVVEPLGDPALPAWVVSTGAAALGECARAVEALRANVHGSCASKARNLLTMSANAAAVCGAREEAEALYHCISATHTDAAFSCWGPFAFASGPPIDQALAAAAFACGRFSEGEQHVRAALALCDQSGAIGPRAWVELVWGEALVDHGDRSAAQGALERALEIATELSMPVVAARAHAALAKLTPAPSRPPAPGPTTAFSPFTLVRTGGNWTLTRNGQSMTLKDVRGVAMLARLVASPGTEIHALDLASDTGASDAVVDLGDSGVLVDARARDEYRVRIAELRAELEEAERFADEGRAAGARRELEALTDQLAGAVGLGGRERRAGSAAERARVTVQRRVREAIKKIADQDAELGRHLDWTVRTGTFCAYEPEGRRK